MRTKLGIPLYHDVGLRCPIAATISFIERINAIPILLARGSEALSKIHLIYEQSATRGLRGLPEKRTRAPSRQPLKIEQLRHVG